MFFLAYFGLRFQHRFPGEGLKSDTTFLQQAVHFAGSSFQDGATGMPVVLNGNGSTAGCDVPGWSAATAMASCLMPR